MSGAGHRAMTTAPLRPSPLAATLGLLVALAALCLLSLCAGRVWAPLSAWTAFGHDPRWVIVFQLRLPRTLLGLLVGAALGASGAALQGYTRNPLADAGVLGVSSTAALGAVLVLYFGLSAVSPWLLPAAAMAGAAAGFLMLLGLAGAGSTLTTFVLWPSKKTTRTTLRGARFRYRTNRTLDRAPLAGSGRSARSDCAIRMAWLDEIVTRLPEDV